MATYLHVPDLNTTCGDEIVGSWHVVLAQKPDADAILGRNHRSTTVCIGVARTLEEATFIARCPDDKWPENSGCMATLCGLVTEPYLPIPGCVVAREHCAGCTVIIHRGADRFIDATRKVMKEFLGLRLGVPDAAKKIRDYRGDSVLATTEVEGF